MKTSTFAILAALLPSLAACGGSSDSDTGETPLDGTANPMGSMGDAMSGALECDPDADIPCIEGIAEPCEGIDSGYTGDEYCRSAPDPELGMQIHVGPDDYSDPDDVAQYIIEPGQETNWYEQVQFPNTETVFTRGYRSYMRPGSHHFIMYGSRDAVTSSGPQTAGGGVESAMGALTGTFLGGATKSIQNIDTKGEYPEDQGIGSEVAPNSSVYVNLHFINTSQEDLIQEIWVNFIYIDEADVTQYVKPVTWYGGLGMNIPPSTHTVLENAPGSCTAPEDIRIGMLTAHAHASTKRVTTLMNGDTVLFEDYDWAEPTEWRYNRSIDNPTPNPDTARSGGYTGLLEAAPGDDFVWQCEVENKSNVNLTFSNSVYEGEMCNVFGFYFTQNRDAGPWVCAFF